MKPFQEARFRRCVDVNGPVPSHRPELGQCHVWTGGGHSKTGRAAFSYMENGKRRWQNASRVAWKLAFGEPPKGRLVCHECDNPSCVRIDHLILGTPVSNMRDRDQRKRNGCTGKRFESNCKLTTDDYESIRKLCASGQTQRSVARLFGVDPSHVSNIVRGVRGTLDTILVPRPRSPQATEREKSNPET